MKHLTQTSECALRRDSIEQKHESGYGSSGTARPREGGGVMPRKVSMAVGAALILLLGFSGVANAQGSVTGSVQGTVKDAEGGVLPGNHATAHPTPRRKGRALKTQ